MEMEKLGIACEISKWTMQNPKNEWNVNLVIWLKTLVTTKDLDFKKNKKMRN